jgi:ACT domain-containing protein
LLVIRRGGLLTNIMIINPKYSPANVKVISARLLRKQEENPMKKYLLMTVVAFVLCGLFAYADTASEKLDALKKKRSELAMQMFNRRIKLIEEDPKLKEIHEKILALHRELAIRLDNDRELIELGIQVKDIDADIDKAMDQVKKEEGTKDKP